MVRFVHASDLRLGLTHRFHSVEARARYAQARFDVVSAIGRLATDERAAFVVVAGDVFEASRVRPRTVVRALEALGDIPVPVYLLPGSHDPLDAASVYRSPTFLRSKPANVTVLEGPEPVQPPGARNVRIVGVPWLSRQPLSDTVGQVVGTLAADPSAAPATGAAPAAPAGPVGASNSAPTWAPSPTPSWASTPSPTPSWASSQTPSPAPSQTPSWASTPSPTPNPTPSWASTPNPGPAIVRILVANGPLDTPEHAHEPYAIRQATLEAAIADGRVAYVALGGQASMLRVGDTQRVWYPGTPEPVDFDGTDVGNVLLVELEGDRCDVSRRSVGQWRLRSETVQLDTGLGPSALRARLDMLPAKERTVIRPMLRGVISLSDRERAQRIIEDGRRWFASIEEPASDGELLVRATDDDFRELGLTGFGSAAVARLRDLAGGSDARSTMAREALALLLRLAGGEGTDEGGGAEGAKRTEEGAQRTEEGSKRTEDGAQRTEDAGHGLADGTHPDGTHPDGTHPDVAYPWRDGTPSHSAATTNHDAQGVASGPADPRGGPA